jgi:hypothetical protein
MYYAWYGLYHITPFVPQALKVHYGNNYPDAFFDWNGSVYFGDGDPQMGYYPLTSMDYVSHELGHGFTRKFSDLIYAGQSGAINEAFSDMAGEAAKYYAGNTNDFEVFKDVSNADIVPQGIYRFMYNPPLDDRIWGEPWVSIGSADDYWEGIDVHNASGVFNKAFYLLATTPGWNTKKAFDVMAYANQHYYWNADTSFVDAACGVIEAARQWGYNKSDVDKAFISVGVVCSSKPSGADLMITKLEFSSDSYDPLTDRTGPTIQATVKNNGTYSSNDYITVRVYFSKDLNISPSVDPYTATFTVNRLKPNESVNISTQAGRPVIPCATKSGCYSIGLNGPYYAAAVVDINKRQSESNENNNTLIGRVINVGGGNYW